VPGANDTGLRVSAVFLGPAEEDLVEFWAMWAVLCKFLCKPYGP
jgi:hypothetical protein